MASPRALSMLGRSAFILFVIAMILFWTWALLLYRPERVNRIGDREWVEWAEQRCAVAQTEMNELADFTRVQTQDSTAVRRRAGIVRNANEIVEAMLDDLSTRSPSDSKGQALIPAWLDRYYLYLDDRKAYADELDQTGEHSLFVETVTEEGIPTSELLETFADENDMPNCAPKRDLN